MKCNFKKKYGQFIKDIKECADKKFEQGWDDVTLAITPIKTTDNCTDIVKLDKTDNEIIIAIIEKYTNRKAKSYNLVVEEYYED